MTRVSTQKNRRQYPIGSGGAPMPQGIMGAEYGAAAEFADLGGLIATSVGQRIHRADAKAQTIEGIAAIDSLWDTTLASYATEPDHTKYKETFDKTIKEFDGVVDNKTNQIAKREIGEYITENMPKWEASRNRAVLGRMQIGLLDSRDRIVDSVKDLDLTDPSALVEAEGRIGAAGDLMREHGGFSQDAVADWTENALRLVDNQEVYQQAQQISATEGWEKAREWIMKQPIDVDAKKGIVSDIRFEASQQQLAYDQQLEKIEVDYLKRLGQEQLSENDLMADLQAGRIDTDLYKEYSNYVDAQVRERLEGAPEQDWDEYDKLQGMVKEYGDGARTDGRAIRDAISESVKAKKTTVTNGMKLLDRVKKSDDTDEPMNRSDAKRGLGVFDSLEAAEISANKDEPYDVIRDIRLKYQKKKDEYENWIKGQEKLTGTDIQKKTAEMTEAIIAEELPGMIERAFNIWVQSPFGVLYRKARGIEKEGEEPAEKKILTSEIAGQYLNLAGGDRAKAEQLARDDGYEW